MDTAKEFRRLCRLRAAHMRLVTLENHVRVRPDRVIARMSAGYAGRMVLDAEAQIATVLEGMTDDEVADRYFAALHRHEPGDRVAVLACLTESRRRTRGEM